MGFKDYSPQIKMVVVHQRTRLGWKPSKIRNALGMAISDRSMRTWVRLYKQTCRVVKDPELYRPRGPEKLLNSEQLLLLRGILETDSSLYLDELQLGMYRATGLWLGLTTIHEEVRQRLGWTLKSARVIHPLRCEKARAKYTLKIYPYPRRCLLFGDESAVAERALTRQRARAPRGKRADRRGVQVRGERYSLLPIVGLDGLLACHVKKGSFTHSTILRFFKEDVLPMMNAYPLPNSVLIIDNAAIHHHKKLQKMFEKQGSILCYLPPYSPDFNPEEKVFASLKAQWRRTRELEKADDPIAQIYRSVFKHVSPELMDNLYRSCGY
ncbi:hypothetical protein P7C70_g8792, partial [Phenoliferia sp. Uapishka_3]